MTPTSKAPTETTSAAAGASKQKYKSSEVETGPSAAGASKQKKKSYEVPSTSASVTPTKDSTLRYYCNKLKIETFFFFIYIY